MSKRTANTDREWLEEWISAVANGRLTMSQRSLSWVETRGGTATAISVARSSGVHLVQLTNDEGKAIVAASLHPFEVLC
jgi:hypothetical protein